MPAEVTWNGIAKSYRVGKFNFLQNRMQVIDDPELIGYLKTTKHFTVVDVAPKKVAAKAAPAAAPVEPDEPAAEKPKPSRGPRTRKPSK
jgi:hypothetical protein